jgi:hypothetical protein
MTIFVLLQQVFNESDDAGITDSYTAFFQQGICQTGKLDIKLTVGVWRVFKRREVGRDGAQIAAYQRAGQGINRAQRGDVVQRRLHERLERAG